ADRRALDLQLEAVGRPQLRDPAAREPARRGEGDMRDEAMVAAGLAAQRRIELDDIGTFVAEGLLGQLDAGPLRRDQRHLPQPLLIADPAVDPERALVDGEDLPDGEPRRLRFADLAAGQPLAQDLADAVEGGTELEGRIALDRGRGGQPLEHRLSCLGVLRGQLLADEDLEVALALRPLAWGELEALAPPHLERGLAARDRAGVDEDRDVGGELGGGARTRSAGAAGGPGGGRPRHGALPPRCGRERCRRCQAGARCGCPWDGALECRRATSATAAGSSWRFRSCARG